MKYSREIIFEISREIPYLILLRDLISFFPPQSLITTSLQRFQN